MINPEAESRPDFSNEPKFKFPIRFTLIAVIIGISAYFISAIFFNLWPFEKEFVAPLFTPQLTPDISDWKTYRNEEYGFEFKYPPHLGEVNLEIEDYTKAPTCVGLGARGQLIIGEFSNTEIGFFGGETLDYQPCGDRGGGIGDIKDFSVVGNELVGLMGTQEVSFKIIDTINISSPGVKAYIVEGGSWVGDFGIVKFSNGKLATLAFSLSLDILPQILSTFRFIE